MTEKNKNNVLRLGDCYLDAFHRFLDWAIMLQSDEWRLCHGIAALTDPLNFGKPFGHAWIESDKIVVDKGRNISKPLYYETGKITFVKRYTYKQAAAMAVKTRRYGPWAKEIFKAEAWIDAGLR